MSKSRTQKEEFKVSYKYSVSKDSKERLLRAFEMIFLGEDKFCQVSGSKKKSEARP